MSEGTKHTPGPWKFEDEYVRAAGGEIVADPYTMPTAEAGGSMEANAVLLALAPEFADLLLEALPFVEEGERFNKPTRRGLSGKIRAALAQAGAL